MERFAQNVRAVMRSRRVSVAALADAVGMHRPNVSRLLNQRSNITLRTAQAIADALDVELSDLLGKSESPA